MTILVPAPPQPNPGEPFADVRAFAHRAMRGWLRYVFLGAGWVLIAAGLMLALLPGHLGVPLLALGVILVLRNSYRARRQFIRWQRRHPRFVFPVRRLIRREPEVAPVIWQQTLRFERLVIPARWRRAGLWRRRYLRNRT